MSTHVFQKVERSGFYRHFSETQAGYVRLFGPYFVMSKDILRPSFTSVCNLHNSLNNKMLLFYWSSAILFILVHVNIA